MGRGRRRERALCLVLGKGLGLRRGEVDALRNQCDGERREVVGIRWRKGSLYGMYIICSVRENGVKAVWIEIP
jgi:hypothetical protein